MRQGIGKLKAWRVKPKSRGDNEKPLICYTSTRSFIELQHQAVQLSALEKYELLRLLSADLKSLSEAELETIQAAEAAKRLEDIRSGKTQMVIGNDWRTAISHKNLSRV